MLFIPAFILLPSLSPLSEAGWISPLLVPDGICIEVLDGVHFPGVISVVAFLSQGKNMREFKSTMCSSSSAVAVLDAGKSIVIVAISSC